MPTWFWAKPITWTANYFNAVEYFSYVIRSFPKKKDLTQEALVWKARTLMYLNQLPQAKLVLDTAIQNINPKKKTACRYICHQIAI